MRRQSRDAMVVEGHAAGRRPQEPHDRFQGGRFAGAVATEQDQHLAGVEREVDAEQDLGTAIGGFEAGDGEHQPPPCPR